MSDSRQLGDPGTPAFQVGKYPFYLLNRLVARYNVIIEEQLRSIGLDIPYWRVLMVLGERTSLSISEIADAAVINLSTMTRIVQRMTAAGLVRCKARADDGRVTDVSLSAKGKKTLAQARAVTSPIYHAVIDGQSESEFDSFLRTLARFHENLTGWESGTRSPPAKP